MEGDASDRTHASSGERDERVLDREEAPNATRCESERAERRDLLLAHRDVQGHDQTQQEERRDHQQAAEPEEERAEVHALVERLRTGAFEVHERQPEGRGIELRPHRRPNRGRVRIRRKPHGRQRAEAVLPELLPRAQGHEGLGRASVLLPVRLVLVPNAAQVERESRIPVAAAVGIAQSGKRRHEIGVGRRARHEHDVADAKAGRLFLEATPTSQHVVREGGHVAGSRLEIRREPGVDDDLVVSQVFGQELVVARQCSDQRVRRVPRPHGHVVDEPGQDAPRARDPEGRVGRRLVDEYPPRPELPAPLALEATQREARIVELPDGSHGRGDPLFPARVRRGQECVGPARLADRVLEVLQAQEHVGRGQLADLQCEGAERPRVEHGHHLGGDRHRGVRVRGHRRVAREGRGCLHADDHRVADARAQARGHRLAQGDPVHGPRGEGRAAAGREGPERVVHAEHARARDAGRTVGEGDRTVEPKRRGDPGAELLGEPRCQDLSPHAVARVGGEGHTARPRLRHLGQTRAHRVPHAEGRDDHRRHHGCGCEGAEVSPPVAEQPA